MKICDPMNDYISRLPKAHYAGCMGLRLSKRPNSKNDRPEDKDKTPPEDPPEDDFDDSKYQYSLRYTVKEAAFVKNIVNQLVKVSGKDGISPSELVDFINKAVNYKNERSEIEHNIKLYICLK